MELRIYQPSKVLGALVCDSKSMRNDGVCVALGQPDGFVSRQHINVSSYQIHYAT